MWQFILALFSFLGMLWCWYNWRTQYSAFGLGFCSACLLNSIAYLIS